MIRKLLTSFWFSYYLCRYQWYRRWHGGRWEYHFIDICRSHLWLNMHPDRKWPEYRQPCSVGTPIVEDY
jgi:uncharacterized protein with von Willebrand factor type A (vWA) domain